MKIKRIQLPFNDTLGEQPLVTVGPTTLYKLDFGNIACSEGSSKKCQANADFRWYSDLPCKARLMCKGFDDSVCGSYGLVWQTFNQTSSTALSSSDICLNLRPYEGSMEGGWTSRISLWQAPFGSFAFSCYFWCTSSGGLPSEQISGNALGGSSLVDLVAFVKVSKSFRGRMDLGVRPDAHQGRRSHY